jgi:hypothetical protein
MNKLEKARWRNILQKAAKANRLFKKGYIVFDHHGTRFNGFKFGNGMLYEGSENCRSVWISKDKLWSEYFHTPIKEFNAKRFDKWTAVHPKHIEKI